MEDKVDNGAMLEVAADVVDRLGVEPCLLAIVVVVLVSAAIIRFTYQHQEKMERIRVKQYLRATGGRKNEPT